MSARTVSVREGRRLARSIVIGPHTLTADRPERISTDTGRTPGELLLTALGSCRQRLLAVADRCPVHRLLTGDVSVATLPTVLSPFRRPQGDMLPS